MIYKIRKWDLACRVLEKAGFQYERTLRNNAVKNGREAGRCRIKILICG